MMPSPMTPVPLAPRTSGSTARLAEMASWLSRLAWQYELGHQKLPTHSPLPLTLSWQLL